MSAHTPGPWKVEINQGTHFNGSYQVWDKNGNAPTDKEDKANRRLIAVAPKLFEFVKLYCDLKGDPESQDFLCWSSKLVDKVEGRED